MDSGIANNCHAVVIAEVEKVDTGVKVLASVGSVITPTTGAGW